MSEEQRKTSDIILNLESKIELLLNLIQNQDMNIKIISNKLNQLINSGTPINQQKNAEKPKQSIIIEAVDVVKKPQQSKSNNNSNNSQLEAPPIDSSKLKIYNKKQEIIEPVKVENKNPVEEDSFEEFKDAQKPQKTSIPIMQRVLDKNNKSVFLADVEVFDMANKKTVAKTRTNGAGKWMASLPIGKYRVLIKKRESLNKEKLEHYQEIDIDGLKAPLELAQVIIK